jgi:hypothetical protein
MLPAELKTFGVNVCQAVERSAVVSLVSERRPDWVRSAGNPFNSYITIVCVSAHLYFFTLLYGGESGGSTKAPPRHAMQP